MTSVPRLLGALSPAFSAFLFGCHPVRVPEEVVLTDAATTLAAARHYREAALLPVNARFSLHLETGGKSVNASGAAVIRPPDHVRIEVSGPLGPPALVIAADGRAANVWQAGKGIYYQGLDADAVLRELTGGAGGLDLVTGLLLGQHVEPAVPEAVTASPPVAVMVGADAGWMWRWCDAAGTCLEETLTARGGHLVAVHAVGADGQTLLDATLTPQSGSPWPGRLTVSLPTLAVLADLRFMSWTPFSAPDGAFLLPAPAGATIVPLSLRKKAASEVPSSDTVPSDRTP